MSDSDNGLSISEWSRRRVMALVGSVGAIGLSGCSSLDEESDGGEDPAADEDSGGQTQIADIAVDSGTVQQTDSVGITVTVANTADEQFDGSIVVRLDSDDLLADESVSVAAGGSVDVESEFEALRVDGHEVAAKVDAGGDIVDTDSIAVSVERYPSSHVSVDGTSLMLDDGSFFFIGGQFNPSDMVLDEGYEEVQDRLFDGLEQLGGTICRFRAYSYDPKMAPFPGEDNEAFFRRFDRAIVAAKRRDIRVVISMIGGAPSYALDPEKVQGNNVATYAHRAESADSLADFYVEDECIRMYKEWVRELMTRENHLTELEYRNDPAVMLWELGNEVETAPDRNPDKHPKNLRPWVEEVGPLVQELAGDQLVSTGGVGWGCHGWSGDERGEGKRDCSTEYRANLYEENAPKSIDVCSVHWWPDPEHYDISDGVQRGVFEEIPEVAHERIEKPLWFGEYNYTYDGDPSAVDEGFFEEQAAALRKWHDWWLEADVAASAIHTVHSRVLHREMRGNEGYGSDAEVMAGWDNAVNNEVRRYAKRSREKSTASNVPPMPPEE